MMIATSLFLLHSLLFISLEFSYGLIRGKPSKTPVVLDLDGNIPELIRPVPLDEDDGSRFYTIKRGFRGEYRIGDVKSGDQLILEDHIMNDKRIVFFIPYDDLDYIEVLNIYKKDDGTTGKESEGFFRQHGDSLYHPVVRTPVELDLQSEEHAPQIVFTATIEGMREYNIMDKLKLYFFIGMVRYGHYILDNEVEDVINKRVVCSLGTWPMTCKVISMMKDMTSGLISYRIDEDGTVTLLERTVEELWRP